MRQLTTREFVGSHARVHLVKCRKKLIKVDLKSSIALLMIFLVARNLHEVVILELLCALKVLREGHARQ